MTSPLPKAGSSADDALTTAQHGMPPGGERFKVLWLGAQGFRIYIGFRVLGFRCQGHYFRFGGKPIPGVVHCLLEAVRICAGAGCPWLTSPFPHSATLVARSKDLG